jgi:hypothetical protein
MAGGKEVMELVATEMEAGEAESCAGTPTREAKYEKRIGGSLKETCDGAKAEGVYVD